MRMAAVVLLLAASATSAQDLRVKVHEVAAEEAGKPIRIDCPVAQTSRLVLPHPAIRVTYSPRALEVFAIEKVASAPRAVFRFRPTQHSATESLRVWVKTEQGEVRLTFVLKSIERGTSVETQLIWKAAAKAAGAAQVADTRPSTPASAVVVPTPAPTKALVAPTMPPPTPTVAKVVPTAVRTEEPTRPPLPSPAVTTPPTHTPTAAPPAVDRPTAAPTPVPTSAPSAAAPVATPAPATKAGLDYTGMATAELVEVGRKEGQPGQDVCELVDALRSEQLTWFRFRLKNGAKLQLRSVTHGDTVVQEIAAEPSGKDLKIVVQVPRNAVTKRSQLTLRFTNDATYKFSLNTSTVFNKVWKLF